MQHKDENTLKLRYILGNVFKDIRENNGSITRNKLEDEYGLGKNTVQRVEDALYDCKIITAWKMSEALGVKFSDIIKTIEEKLDKNFSLIEK